ncbi:50S ribosomal protein L11 methyltransferase [Liquorilactobacillus oeni]|uniref:Ribosomal protein L11 methyltransferase n=1 Tax=Liquorilactobacillus oeni DSM 19972 TaxID=1423777 RepID=A0A0R1MG30_9LACO|nr:50S ribosomal protein L11 methyltransferase [Liquorilactobacillus oeni]KRL04293.1 ribosomal protein L11 methyltransferase [Liquorilactobacillus oeni DSM 19972]
MHWQKLTIETTQEAESAIEAILYSIGTTGIQKEDSTTNTKNKRTFYLSSYFSEDRKIDKKQFKMIKERVAQLSKAGFEVKGLKVTLNNVDDQKWAHEWEKYYHAQRITRFLTVVPTWEDYERQQSGELVIRLNPGAAFGTGTHPTTILALSALENCVFGKESVIDVGTGSGVLSIAACKLGVAKVFACDIDKKAVASANLNIKLNAVAQKIEIRQASLLEGAPKKAELIIANVLPEIQLLLLPQIGAHLKAGGKLIMSGIIMKNKNEILTQAQKYGLFLRQLSTDGKWVCFILQKKSGD